MLDDDIVRDARDVGGRIVRAPPAGLAAEVREQLGTDVGEIGAARQGVAGDVDLPDDPRELQLRSPLRARRWSATHPVPEVADPEERVGAVQQARYGTGIVAPGRVVVVAALDEERMQIVQRVQLVVLVLVDEGGGQAECAGRVVSATAPAADADVALSPKPLLSAATGTRQLMLSAMDVVLWAYRPSTTAQAVRKRVPPLDVDGSAGRFEEAKIGIRGVDARLPATA